MSVEILLPKLGPSMNEADLVEWLAVDGSRVEAGKPLYVLDCDKAAQEIECPASGTLKILAPVGGLYPVGTLLGTIS